MALGVVDELLHVLALKSMKELARISNNVWLCICMKHPLNMQLGIRWLDVASQFEVEYAHHWRIELISSLPLLLAFLHDIYFLELERPRFADIAKYQFGVTAEATILTSKKRQTRSMLK